MTYCPTCNSGPLEEIVDTDDETDLYTVLVPYKHSDCCRSHDTEVEIEMRAKSPEEARGLAKRAIAAVPTAYEVYSTTIIDGPDT